MRKRLILTVFADDMVRQEIERLLPRTRVEVVHCRDSTEALARLSLRTSNAAVCVACGGDSTQPLGLACAIRRLGTRIPLILMTSCSSEGLAIGALRAGFDDYLRLPLSLEEFSVAVERHAPGLSENCESDSNLSVSDRFVGNSRVMRELRALVARIAPTDCSVLITGETGTGKELVVALIHASSPRRTKPLVCINCAAVPDALFESEIFGYERGAFTGADIAYEGKLRSADGGTVYLDEVADLSLHLQAKILRVVENKEVQGLRLRRSVPVDVRFVAATNRDLEALTEEGKFREDLYYRLAVSRIHLPPLRDRNEDIPALLDYYLGKLNQHLRRHVEGLTPEARQCLTGYRWPGNVRELKNVLESILIAHSDDGRIALMDLPERVRAGFKGTTETRRAADRQLLIAALDDANWNITRTARALHWSRVTVYRKISKYRIVREMGETPATPMFRAAASIRQSL
jgi:DNA-binding NtrC family response regulator